MGKRKEARKVSIECLRDLWCTVHVYVGELEAVDPLKLSQEINTLIRVSERSSSHQIADDTHTHTSSSHQSTT